MTIFDILLIIIGLMNFFMFGFFVSIAIIFITEGKK